MRRHHLDMIETGTAACALSCRGTGLLLLESEGRSPRALDAAMLIPQAARATAAVMRAAVMGVAAVPTGRDRQREAKHEHGCDEV